jgi:hypothetical protein
MTTMRVATPCSENLDAMPRNAAGDYLCTKCDRAVADLRRVPRKRALAVIDATGTNENTNGQPETPTTPVVSTGPTVPGRAQNVSYPEPEITAVAGGLAFSGP